MDYEKIDRISRTQDSNTSNVRIQYGTAGFRTKSDILDHVLFRMGVLAALRSKAKNAAIGLMITASHNEEPDNGVKLVDPDGEMLEASWESIATDVANAADSDLVKILQRIVKDYNINEAITAKVVVGRDTRQSSQALSAAAIRGIHAADAIAMDYGIVTTPQLHYLVVRTNNNTDKNALVKIEEYYDKLCTAFQRIRSTVQNNGNYTSGLILDAANGVGAIAAKEFQDRLKDYLSIEIFNEGNGALNHKCGADYVKVHQGPPSNVPIRSNVRCVSIDGDADRIVYYYVDNLGKFHLLDGDRIATLVASYLKDLVEASGLTIQLGLVQTAYANGASTDYIADVLKIPVACVPTGVKHLHHRATEFDIGVYFEANGHGTVVFTKSVVERIRAAANDQSILQTRREAASKLLDIIDVINQFVGDALSDMLLVETILHSKGWDLATWESSYTDFPNRQLKVRVKDRNVVTTTDAERQCVTPEGLQNEINKLVALYTKGRSFVRPSGTEDVVRVYAECNNATDVEKLAAQVSLAVYQLASGVGPEPVIPSHDYNIDPSSRAFVIHVRFRPLTIRRLFEMWQDNEVRFDVAVSQLQMRVGELLIDKLEMVEDTKGNAGDRGRLMVSNLRIIWHSMTLPRINLSIGYNTVVNVTTKNFNTIHGGTTQALHILTTYRNCRYEFIFTNQDFKSSRHYTSVIGVFRAYTSTKMYREIKLRGGFVHENRLSLLPLENIHSTTSGVWNLSTEQGNVGTFIVTNIRVVWYADMNNQFNVSLPYLTIASINIRSSKFGQTLVTMSTDLSGGYVLGFRVDPVQKLHTLRKEIVALQAAYKKSPIFGVEYTFEHEAITQPEYKPEVIKEIEDNEDEITNVLGLYFTEEGVSQRRPIMSSHLGLAAEESREGTTLQTLWELLPAT